MIRKVDKEKLYQYVKDNYWKIFIRDTGTLSNTCRVLALGLGGVLLTGKVNVNDAMFSCYIKGILLLLFLFFIFDAGQYLIQSISFRNLALKYDKEINDGTIEKIDKLIEKPGMNDLTNAFFYIKLIFLGMACIFFLIWLFLF